MHHFRTCTPKRERPCPKRRGVLLLGRGMSGQHGQALWTSCCFRKQARTSMADDLPLNLFWAILYKNSRVDESEIEKGVDGWWVRKQL